MRQIEKQPMFLQRFNTSVERPMRFDAEEAIAKDTEDDDRVIDVAPISEFIVSLLSPTVDLSFSFSQR